MAVWSVMRLFDEPQVYKYFIKSCSVLVLIGDMGTLREDADARSLKNKSFSYYEKLSLVFEKDRATGVNVQMPAYVIERLDEEEVEVRDDVELMDSINVATSSNVEGQENHKRNASFSKRTNGVFGKASELSTLCGANMTVLIFSPTRKPHSFGSPSVDQVVEQFLSIDLDLCNCQFGQVVQDLNQEFMELTSQLEASKAKKVVLQRHLQGEDCKWIDSLDGLTLEELDHLRESLGRLKKEISADSMAIDHVGSSQHKEITTVVDLNSIPVVTNPRGVVCTHTEPSQSQSNSSIETIEYLDLHILFEDI
ncbi:hypothetical protein Cni_G28386 [Canna indica]|uniref:MADS-box domain-containing protein n=1 Tax=Canna indica TaxID=4628 RepID=A0AAQ3L3D1_9LILI|nr:hypothetical protein Cni_G28386 [Canna indica]